MNHKRDRDDNAGTAENSDRCAQLTTKDTKDTKSAKRMTWQAVGKRGGGHLECVATSAIVWVMVGVPVAAAIAALRVFVFVLLSLPEMAVTAAVLGAVQGVWLAVAGPPRSNPRWRGAASGGVLGLFGFPPLVSDLSIVVDRTTVAVFLLAAAVGGIAAGIAASNVAAPPLRTPRSSPGRTIIVGAVLLLIIAGVDYRFYWPATADRLPVRVVSHQAITELSAGNARGSTWSGCYDYLGQLSRGSGVVGGEGGVLTVTQADGALKVFDGDARPSIGGVDGDGHFRFGIERTVGEGILRVLWDGNFNSATFTRRLSLFRGSQVVNTTRLTGTARRVPCNR